MVKGQFNKMTNEVITFIGAGNMGGSLIGGLIANGFNPKNIWATNKENEILTNLKQQFQINITSNNHEAVKHAEVLVLSLKPQVMAEVVQELSQEIRELQPLVLSIAAGIRIDRIEQWIGHQIAVVRTMPNTPALVGAGAAALIANQHVTARQKELAESILRAVGITIWLQDENLLDVVTALSGSGPAYYFLMMESLQDAAMELGLPEAQAKILTLQTCFGAARMALESQTELKRLRENVTSPGGTTEKALKVLEDHDIRQIFKKALEAATKRSQELAEII